MPDMEFFDTSDLYTEEITLRLDSTSQARPDIDWVPAYYFTICLPDGTPVGGCDLRIGHTRKTYLGGNIGYHVNEAYRGRHYAAKACALLFRQARKHGMDHLFISCPVDNLASNRTCQLAGGELAEAADVPLDNDMYAEGIRRVNIYRFDL